MEMDAVDPELEQRLSKTLQKLELQREQHVGESDYVAAAQAEKGRRDLQRLEHKRRQERLSLDLSARQTSLKEERDAKLAQCEKEWEDKLQDFDTKASGVAELLRAKHQDKIDLAIGAFDVLNPHRPKYSPKVLNMRHREKNAARMCKFDEAHFMKLKCDAQVRREELAYRRQKEAKLDAELRKLEQSQSLEMASLLKRQKRDRSTLERGRDKAIDCIRTKYRNRSIKISSQYKIADAKAKNAENVSEKAAHPVQVPMTRRGSQLTL